MIGGLPHMMYTVFGTKHQQAERINTLQADAILQNTFVQQIKPDELIMQVSMHLLFRLKTDEISAQPHACS
jgi:hypothetical protein